MKIPALFSRFRLTLLVIVLVIAASIPSVYFFRKYQASQLQLNDPSAFAKEEAARLVDEVGKFILLPTDEEPTVATITDQDKLKNQAFFANALNGDKLLIYTNAKKAILYRPSTNKIIEVAPINIGPTATASATTQGAQTEEAKGPSFVLLNGTDTTGLTRTFETNLKAKLPTAEIVDRDNAKKRDYEKSILVDLTGTKSAQATELATTLELEVATLPAGETKPTGADFLIILGADKK